MPTVPFIAIEGPIGVGKTSLAKKLSAYFGYHLLPEIVEENPFLDKFYNNSDEWSFQTEMFFLCNRFKQMEDIERTYLNHHKAVIADYHISKNMIFAGRTLPEDKYEKYKQIHHILTRDLPIPNIMIYLHASLDTMLERIRKRGRTIEHHIQPSYLSQIADDYDAHMNAFEALHPDMSIIRIDGDDRDFVNHQDDLEAIIRQVQQHIDKQIGSDH
ncbi:deoxynucleoside kinase [Lentibacillus halophilus]|uniref:Deoxynucleoside kinase n=1 Tax=Lentibacillus halophilus TaxID=295065 RepID=A0ABN0Z5W8_9BACI